MSEEFPTLSSLVKRWAKEQPDKDVFIFVNAHRRLSAWTSRDVYVLGGRFASRLLQCGFQKGDVVANTLPNSPERVITDIGINMAGCAVLNCQVLEQDGGDFWHTALVSQCKGVLLIDDRDQSPYTCLKDFVQETKTDKRKCCLNISAPMAPELKKVILIGRGTSKMVNENIGKDVRELSFLESLIEGSEPEVFVDCSPTDLSYIFTTSGTTGYCKLVPRSHENLVKMALTFQGGKKLRFFSDRPLGWSGGFPFDYYGYCTMRILQDNFESLECVDVKDKWSAIQVEKCNGAIIIPEDIAKLMVAFGDSPPDRKLDVLMTAGQPIKKRHAAAAGFLAHTLTLMYASTETGLVSVANLTEPDQFEDCFCGRPLRHLSLKVVDESMKQVPPGTTGSILVKSDILNVKYMYYSPGAEAPTLFTDDGYFVTEDRGAMTENGGLYVYGRDGAVIHHGTFIVYLSWLETIIGKCPGVDDVVVVSWNTGSDHDKVCACVIPRKGSDLKEEGVKEFYNANFVHELSALDKFIPPLDFVLFYSVFPLRPTGKIDKGRLQKYAYEQFGSV